jgi:molecular chaperone GrpE
MSGGDEAELPPDPFSPATAAEESTDAGAPGADLDPGTGAGAGAGASESGPGTEAGSGEPEESALADTEGMEEVLDPLTAMTIERDEYLDTLRRVQAEFENYKKRMVRQQTEQLERAAEGLVNKLLPVLDNLALALSHIDTDATEEGKALGQLNNSVWDVLAKEGLEKVEPLDQEFDPNEAEAVMHEPAEDGQDGSKVVEVFRPGYRYRGRVLRAAMVKVRG